MNNKYVIKLMICKLTLDYLSNRVFELQLIYSKMPHINEVPHVLNMKCI